MEGRFFKDLLNNLGLNWNNNFKDNFDFLRFGTPEREVVDGADTLQKIAGDIAKFEEVYSLLADNSSKFVFIQVLSFRILGHKKVRLPLSTDTYWDSILKLKEYIDENKFLEATYPVSDKIKKLHYMDLKEIGLQVSLFTSPRTVLMQFLVQQYRYKVNNDLIVGAKNGDVVLDGGSCWGDTTLNLAHQVGPDGMVYGFEFVPGNLNVLRKNLSLNPELLKRIKIIEKPLWDNSGVEMYFQDYGPGSRVLLQPSDNIEGVVRSILIDDFVREENLSKVDFIKMDIEGSEQKTITGAINTLERFKPQLAISIYHNFSDDFVNIAAMLNDLNMGYKFYLDHFTIHHEETVLFATAI